MMILTCHLRFKLILGPMMLICFGAELYNLNQML